MDYGDTTSKTKHYGRKSFNTYGQEGQWCSEEVIETNGVTSMEDYKKPLVDLQRRCKDKGWQWE